MNTFCKCNVKCVKRALKIKSDGHFWLPSRVSSFLILCNSWYNSSIFQDVATSITANINFLRSMRRNLRCSCKNDLSLMSMALSARASALSGAKFHSWLMIDSSVSLLGNLKYGLAKSLGATKGTARGFERTAAEGIRFALTQFQSIWKIHKQIQILHNLTLFPLHLHQLGSNNLCIFQLEWTRNESLLLLFILI